MKLIDKIDLSLSSEDLKTINKKNSDNISRFLARLRDSEFKIGDVLIKKTKRIYQGTTANGYIQKTKWDTVMVPYRKVPRKFVVVHIDNYGIPSVKPLNVNGKLGADIKCLNEVDFRLEIFEEDPDYAAAIIFDQEEYDPIEFERNGGRKKREKTL